MRLLLVEDDAQLGDAIKMGLVHMGYVVDWIQDGELARQALKTEEFDLIILDLGLPRLPGLELLQSVRQAGLTTPVLILTAQDSVDSKIKGLDSGADDYLSKPFDLNELGARVRALIRRAQGRAEPLIHYRNLILDPAAHEVRVDGEVVNLHRREFTLLHILLENQGVLLTREQLMQRLYGWDADIDSNTLEVHVHNLRKKLDAFYIRTIRGLGYMVEKVDH